MDLNALLDIGEDAPDGPSQKHIVVKMGDDVIVYKTNATLVMSRVADDDFYRLPSVIRESGCAKWVRGAALLESPDTNEEEATPALAIWLDLRVLGKELLSEGKKLGS